MVRAGADHGGVAVNAGVLVTVSGPELRAIPRPRRESGLRRAAPVAAVVAVDAVAAAILLLGGPRPAWLAGLVAALAHGAAALLARRLGRGRSSRRALCVAAVLAVPLAGAFIAAAALLTRGRGSVPAVRPRRPRRRRSPVVASVQRLARAPSLCDVLESDPEEQRRAALSALAGRRDPGAIALLRWAADRDHDLAASAAQVLDEIGERAEREMAAGLPAEARRGTG